MPERVGRHGGDHADQPATGPTGREPAPEGGAGIATALALQRTAGNTATGAVLRGAAPGRFGAASAVTRAPLLRDGDADEVVWRAPTGADCRLQREAGMELLYITDELRSVQRAVGVGEIEALDLALDEGRSYIRVFVNDTEAPLTARYVAQLTAWASEATRAHRRGMSQVRRPARNLLHDMSEAPQVEALPDERAMELHTAFTQGATDRLGDVHSVIEKVSEYNGHVQDLTRRAGQALDGVDAASTVSEVSDAAGRAGDYLDTIGNVVQAARGFATLAEIDNQSPDEMQNSIGQVSAALDGIDAGMTFVRAVPVLGTLWSEYYLPAAQQCLSLLRRIATQQARDWRSFFAAMSDDWHRGPPPNIPDDYEDLFPGGRPVFEFIWSVLCDQEVPPSSSVKEYFLAHEELFEAGTGDELETERHGWFWHDERLTTDLWPWARVNRRRLWAMLYGDLAYPAGIE